MTCRIKKNREETVFLKTILLTTLFLKSYKIIIQSHTINSTYFKAICNWIRRIEGMHKPIILACQYWISLQLIRIILKVLTVYSTIIFQMSNKTFRSHFLTIIRRTTMQIHSSIRVGTTSFHKISHWRIRQRKEGMYHYQWKMMSKRTFKEWVSSNKYSRTQMKNQFRGIKGHQETTLK
jgi:hypothetical protein